MIEDLGRIHRGPQVPNQLSGIWAHNVVDDRMHRVGGLGDSGVAMVTNVHLR